jgi:hypothetical protein
MVAARLRERDPGHEEDHQRRRRAERNPEGALVQRREGERERGRERVGVVLLRNPSDLARHLSLLSSRIGCLHGSSGPRRAATKNAPNG